MLFLAPPLCLRTGIIALGKERLAKGALTEELALCVIAHDIASSGGDSAAGRSHRSGLPRQRPTVC